MTRSNRTKIPGGEMIEVAKRAKPVVAAALEEMMRRSKAQMPFVILHDLGTGKFVQWCGSSTERLLFDVPAANIRAEPVASVQVAVERGLEVLSMLSVRPDEMPFADGLNLEESDKDYTTVIFPTEDFRCN